jgi:hypothetical protein
VSKEVKYTVAVVLKKGKDSDEFLSVKDPIMTETCLAVGDFRRLR